MPQDITLYNLPKINVNEVNKGTIAIIGSRIMTKSLHKAYGVQGASRILRRVSIEYVGYIGSNYAILHDYDVVDLGDFNRNEIDIIVESVLNKGGLPIVIGGDHATTYYATRRIHFNKLLWLDAHLDLLSHEDYGGVEAVNHANVLLKIINEKKDIDVTVIGFRGFSTPKSEIHRANELGIKVIHSKDSLNILSNALSVAQVISLDLDFFDAREFSATRVPEINGISIDKFIDGLNRSNPKNLIYFDIVEYCPDIDPGFVNAKILVQIIPLIIGRIIAVM